ncbi:MAG: neutral/alkaline non-lysosomal ceramidase N-terminal domain-containing protein [Armatimonadetes bacterium]|nr:neutral/alkaline non-lysosomal ceramidase N-terminal domain-containing protein [Armatimonadota bacterium]
MLLGIGKATITPPLGTPLAGFAHRKNQGAEEVLDDLEVRAFWLQDEIDKRNATAIVTADIISFGSLLTGELQSKVKTQFGLPPERLLLAASHTHSGPQTCENMVGCGDFIPEVVTIVRKGILEALSQARYNLSPVKITIGRGRCEGYAINRRLFRDGVCLFAPNPNGVRDDDVTVIAFHDITSDSVIAVLFHFTCHPTTMGDFRITADYPGAARRFIEKTLNCSAGFLPGCFGDIRPNCTFIGSTRFRLGQPEDVVIFGEALGKEVIRILQSELIPVTPLLNGQMMVVELPFARLPNSLQQEPSTCPLTIQRLDIAREITLIAMNGEICCDYGLFIKRLYHDRFIIPMGYCNGMVGYICPSRYFEEGGYEPLESFKYMKLPAPFSPEIETTIKEGIMGLMGLKS